MFDRTFPPPGPGPKRVTVTIELNVYHPSSHRVVAEEVRDRLRWNSAFSIAEEIGVVDASPEVQELVTKRWRKLIGADYWAERERGDIES